MQTGTGVTFTAIGLTIGLAVGGASWHLRTLIRTELRKASYATDIRLEHGAAQIRDEFRAGRENSEREMAAIRGVFDDRQGREPGRRRVSDLRQTAIYETLRSAGIGSELARDLATTIDNAIDQKGRKEILEALQDVQNRLERIESTLRAR